MPSKVFWEDPYRTTLDTRVATVCGAQVTLESTIFYAFSGGQESDSGSIGGQPVLAQQAQAIIAADSAIVSAFSDQERQRRYWEVPGFARVPCGGTHLKRTGEIGTLRLKRNNIGRGKERIEIFVD